jgi:RNA polymerase sigma factor (sigma-70 family)
MNFLKFRAERNRRKLDLRKPDHSIVHKIGSDLDLANQVRNQIVSANVRLVVANAKKFARSIEQMSDLIGEGMSPLIRSVELFDVSLGNRFSTYVTWAVRNQMLRWLKRSRTHQDVFPRGSSTSLENFPDKRPDPEFSESIPLLQTQAVNRLLQSLSERERKIVAARFGLEGQPSGQSLTEISKQIGLSKERVRQILLHSLLRLREFISYDEFESMS